MEKLVWNEQLNIGVEAVDKAHANIFRIAGKMIDLVEHEENYRTACKEGLKYLEEYSMKHFSEEEAYMRSVRYSGYAKHKQIHDAFRDQTLVTLKKTLELSGYSRAAAQRFLGVLLGWITGHIMTEDQEITGEIAASRIYDTSFQSSVIADAFCQAMQDVFHIRTRLADEHYNGRNMGMEFFCRLCYNTEDGKRVQLLLGVEERLIRRGVGLIFGLSAMHDPAMIQEVSMQLYEQLLHHMSKLFKSDISYQLVKEELLTSDEFRSDFMTRYPCSMLFETRLGYFAFCARTWKNKKKT